MRKTKKELRIFITLVIIHFIYVGMVYADPNSSKGFAEYDDIKAQEENQKVVEQQEKEQNELIGKSTNNYLENLQVEGYELSPQFDAQTVEYVLKDNIQGKEINIIATPSDEKATIEGSGKIKVDTSQKQFRIDVTAESGTVRTYQIYLREVTKEEDEKVIDESSESSENNEVLQEESVSGVKENHQRYIMIAIIFVVFVIIYMWLRAKTRKRKH